MGYKQYEVQDNSMQSVNIFPVVVKGKEASFHFFSQMKKGGLEGKELDPCRRDVERRRDRRLGQASQQESLGLRVLIGSSAGDTRPQGIISAEGLLFRYFVMA